MTYASPADVREAVAPDGSFAGTCATFTDEQLTTQITRAQGLVDGTVGESFEDSNVPPLLKGLVVALGAYYATLAYRKGKDLAQFDPIYLLYQDAMATLKGIQQDVINPIPPGPDPDPIPTTQKPKVLNPLLYGATAFTGDDFGLALSPPCGIDGTSITTDPGVAGLL